MTTVAGLSFQQIEDYLFSNQDLSFDPSKLVPGTETHYFITLLNYLSNNIRIDNDGTNKEAHQLFLDYKFHFPKSPYLSKIQLRNWMIAYDQVKSEEERKSILSEITKALAHRDIVSELQQRKALLEEKKIRMSQQDNLNELNLESLGISTIWKKAPKSLTQLRNLSPKVWNQIPLEETTEEVLLAIIDEAELHTFGNQLIDKINQVFTEKNSHGQRRLIDSLESILDRLSVPQINYWREINSDLVNYSRFVQQYILKVYSKELDFEFYIRNQLATPERYKRQRLQNLEKIWQFVSRLPKMYLLLQKNLVIEILKTKYLLEEPDMELFALFLKDYHQPSSVLTTDYSQFILELNDTIHVMTETDIITAYLTEIFKESEEDTNKFKGLIDKQVLEKCFAKTKLLYDLSGKNDQKYLEQLKLYESEAILQKSEIVIKTREITDFSKAPTFELEVKNITELNLKVFELDVENFFRANKQPINPNIPLDGIIPSIEKHYKIQGTNPFKYYRISCELAELKDCKGWFIREFYSGGVKCRASLKNGSLKFVQRYTGAGNLFMIINEKNEICKDASVLYENKLYRASDKGHIMIPYAKHESGDVFVLLKGDGLYDVVSFEQKKESYQLQTEFLMEASGIVTNCEAQVLIQPRLYSNQIQTALKLLRNPTLTITTVNEKGIATTAEFTDFELDKERDFIQRFRVPPKLTTIEFVFTAQVFKTNEDKWETLENRKIYQLKNDQYVDQRIAFFDLQLIRKNNLSYVLLALGKNGERIQDLDVEVNLAHPDYAMNFTQLLRTDKAGEIKLDELHDFDSLSVQTVRKIAIPSFLKTWNLRVLNRPVYQSNRTLYAVKGETIFFEFEPISGLDPHAHLSLQEFSKFGSIFLRSCKEVIKCHEEKQLLVVTLSELPEGQYLFTNSYIRESYKINVVEGHRLADNALIYSIKDNLIYENVLKVSAVPKVCDIQKDDEKKLIKLQLKNHGPNTRVHLIGLPYFPNDQNYKAVLPAYNSNLNILQSLQNAQPPQNNLYISSSFEDEVTAYVEDRRNQPKIMGSIFTKPTYLLDSVGTAGGNPSSYENKSQGYSPYRGVPNYSASALLDPSRWQQYGRASNASLRQLSKGLTDKAVSDKKAANLMKVTAGRHFSSGAKSQTYHQLFLQNHLQNPAKIVNSLEPNQDGVVTISNDVIDIAKYSALQLLVTSPDYSFSHFIDLNTKIQSKDLTLKPSMDPEGTYAETKKELILQEGGKFVINDPVSAQIQIIDNQEKLFKCQLEIKKSMGHDNENLPEGYKTWEFLTRWHQLTLAQKNSYLDKYSSHELHFFIYNKDPEYFNSVVKKHLENKVEKRIVDQYLLDEDIISLWGTKPSKLEQLNAFEKSLVVAQLAKKQRFEEAKAVADLLRWEDENNNAHKYVQAVDEKIFEVVLNMKSLDLSSTASEAKALEEARQSIIKSKTEKLEVMRANPPGAISGLGEGWALSRSRGDIDSIRPGGKLRALEPELESVNRIMARNIHQTLDRGESMEDLMLKSNTLSKQSAAFYKSAKKESAGFGGFGFLKKAGEAVASLTKAKAEPNLPPLLEARLSVDPQSLSQVSNSREMQIEDREYDLRGFQSEQKQLSLKNMVQESALYDEVDVVTAKKEIEVYQDLESTKEYAEMHYYNIKDLSSFPHRVPCTRFWVNYADHLITTYTGGNPNKPFLSPNFKYVWANHTEMLLAYSLMSIDTVSGLHLYENNKEGKVTVILKSNALVFFKEIAASSYEELDDYDILILKRYFDPNDKIEILPNGKKKEKFVKEFYAQRPYGCQIVITNLTQKALNADILYQIPAYCLPLLYEMNERTYHNEVIQPYTSKTYEFYFYAPQEYQTIQIPIYLNQGATTFYMSKIEHFRFEDPQNRIKAIDEEVNEVSLEYCSIDKLLELFKAFYLRPQAQANIRDMIIQKIKENLYDKQLYEKVLNFLRDHCSYEPSIWDFAFFHLDEETLREVFETLLEKSPQAVAQLGFGLNTLLVSTNQHVPIEESFYYEILNGLQVASRNKISSGANREGDNPSYRRLLVSAIERGKNALEDDITKLKLAIMWIYRGKEKQAFDLLEKINEKKLDEIGKLQFDYVRCYLDTRFNYSDMHIAKEVSACYLDYPINL